MAAAFNRFDIFTDDLTAAKHDFASHVFKIMLTDVAPDATDEVLADLTELAPGFGYSAGGSATTITRANASGVESIKGTDVVFTASGGSIGPFRYAVLYNDSQATPAKPLVGWWDYGSPLTLGPGDLLRVDTAADATDVILTIG